MSTLSSPISLPPVSDDPQMGLGPSSALSLASLTHLSPTLCFSTSNFCLYFRPMSSTPHLCHLKQLVFSRDCLSVHDFTRHLSSKAKTRSQPESPHPTSLLSFHSMTKPHPSYL